MGSDLQHFVFYIASWLVLGFIGGMRKSTMEVVASSSAGEGRPTSCDQQRDEEVQLAVKTKLGLLSWRVMAVYTHHYLFEGIAFVAGVFSLVLLWGNP
jgi:hypothetical protein